MMMCYVPKPLLTRQAAFKLGMNYVIYEKNIIESTDQLNKYRRMRKVKSFES